MAYASETHAGDAGHGGQPVGRPVASAANWLGAVVSLALVAGVGVWGYKLLVRDVSGIPVVKANSDPMRVAPDDPGGLPAEHMGFSVNSVAGTGLAEAPADTLRLAPPPAGLAEEDVPLGSVRAEARPETAPESPETLALASVPAGTEAPEVQADGTAQSLADRAVAADLSENDAIQALANQIAAGIKPLTEQDLSNAPEVTTQLSDPDADAAVDTAPNPLAALPGVARSPRPAIRPRGLQTASLSPAIVPVALNASEAEIAADAVPVGTRLVQLGAYESPEVARAEWDRLNARFGDYLQDKSRIVQKASSGGRTFYRLRAMGFDDIADARRFCAAFVAGRADCIPLVTR